MPVALKNLLLLALATLPCAAAETNALLDRWFAAQAQAQTWRAEFTQTRTLKSLVQPLTTSGRVWFAAPGSFRWELGTPPQSIAVRGGDSLLVIYPPLHRAERYPLAAVATEQWREMASLLEAGFPRSRAELNDKFLLTAQTVTNGVCELRLQPKSAAARKLMPEFHVAFAVENLALTATEMRFADGSTMRNDFTNAQLNVAVDKNIFTPSLNASYQITEPFKTK